MVDPVEIVVAAAAWKVLGPTLEKIGKDFKSLYMAGRDRIINRAAGKVENLDDGKCANLRVARDVLWNGAFSESEVCVEYYAGLLAASRSKDGLNDEAAPFVDAVKSLASSQLRLHYDIYRSLERILEEDHANGLKDKWSAYDIVNGSVDVFIAGHDSTKSHLDLQVLLRNGLIAEYTINSNRFTREGRDSILFYCRSRPTLFGISLYAAAHNQLEWWQAFGYRSFGEFGGVEPPDLYGRTLEELLEHTR